MPFAFPAPAVTSLPIHGQQTRFPVHRIYCVGRNYAEHAREMGATVDRGTPIFFCKPSDAVVEPGQPIPYPPGTRDLHHEVELVIALGHDADGFVAVDQAARLVYGYSVGLDLTRRDLQAQLKAKGLPWDIAKGFDASAPIAAISAVADGAYPRRGTLWLDVNGERRQSGELADMLWSVDEIISSLSALFRLRAGDLIFTGTPAGVAALQAGDRFQAGLDQTICLQGQIAPALA